MNLRQDSHELIPYFRVCFVIAAGVAHMPHTEFDAEKGKKEEEKNTFVNFHKSGQKPVKMASHVGIYLTWNGITTHYACRK